MGRNLIGRAYDSTMGGFRYVGGKIGEGANYIGGIVKPISKGLNSVVKVGGALAPIALMVPGLGEVYVAGLGTVAGVAGGVASVNAVLN